MNDLRAAASPQASPAAQAPGDLAISVLSGDDARTWIAKADNIADWQRVYTACPWGTVFQAPGFFDVWFRHYGDLWTPLLVLGRDGANRLTAILPLAVRDGLITGVGAHQAEYQGWLAEPSADSRFMASAVTELTKHFPGREIRLKFLPSGTPQHELDELSAGETRARVRAHTRGLLPLDATVIAGALKKKSNRSKVNRLKRMGALELRVMSATDLERCMDEVAAFCDFRQGAINDSCPFADDAHKRPFHLAWLRDRPELLHVSGLFLNDRLISALLLAMSPRDAHIAIVAHAPEYAEHSPSKINIYETALKLVGSPVARLDMTPGGDDWKLRFSEETDTVHELVVHPGAASAWLHRLRETAEGAIRSTLSRAGLSPAKVREAVAGVRRSFDAAKPDGAPAEQTHWRTYRVPPDMRAEPGDVRVNALQDLLRLGPTFANQPRQAFLSDALRRMESGERAYSLAVPDRMLCLAWSAPQGEADEKQTAVRILRVAFASDGDTAETRRAIVSAMLNDAATRSKKPVNLVAVVAQGRATAAVVESLGFVASAEQTGAVPPQGSA